MDDWVKAGLIAVLSGAATAFGKRIYARLRRIMEDPTAPSRPSQKIWPNGERQQIIEAIDALRADSRAFRADIRELFRIVEKLAERFPHKGID